MVGLCGNVDFQPGLLMFYYIIYIYILHYTYIYIAHYKYIYIYIAISLYACMLFIYSFILRPSVSVLEAFQSTSPNGCIWWMRPGNLVQRLWVLLHPSHWCDKDWERARHQHVHLHRKVSFQEPSLPLDATCIFALV